ARQSADDSPKQIPLAHSGFNRGGGIADCDLCIVAEGAAPNDATDRRPTAAATHSRASPACEFKTCASARRRRSLPDSASSQYGEYSDNRGAGAGRVYRQKRAGAIYCYRTGARFRGRWKHYCSGPDASADQTERVPSGADLFRAHARGLESSAAGADGYNGDRHDSVKAL